MAKPFRTLSVSPTNPVAGSGVVIVPSAIQRVRIKSLMFTFTTDATVANRNVWLEFLDPNNVPVFANGSATAIAASTVQGFVACPVYNVPGQIWTPNGAALGFGIPDIWLPPNWRIKISSTAEDTGDQFSAITYMADFAEDVWDREEAHAEMLAYLSSLAP